jgi:hypothetical protein
LEVLKPFHHSTGALHFSVNCLRPSERNRAACRMVGDNHYEPLSPSGFVVGDGTTWEAELPTVLIHPMERFEATLDLPSPVCTSLNLMSYCELPRVQDSYQLIYTYAAWPKAEFSIVEPNIEALSLVLLPRQREVRGESGNRQMADRKALVIALEYDGHHVLAMGLNVLERYIDEERLFTYKKIGVSNFRRYGPYRVIAESDTATISIEAVPDKDENLAIRAKDASGHVRILSVGSDHRLKSAQ